MSIMKNIPTLDLRTLTSADTLKDVEEISNVGIIILPENGDPEVLNAFHAIPKSTTEYGLRRTFSVSCPPSSNPT